MSFMCSRFASSPPAQAVRPLVHACACVFAPALRRWSASFFGHGVLQPCYVEGRWYDGAGGGRSDSSTSWCKRCFGNARWSASFFGTWRRWSASFFGACGGDWRGNRPGHFGLRGKRHGEPPRWSASFFATGRWRATFFAGAFGRGGQRSGWKGSTRPRPPTFGQGGRGNRELRQL